MIVKCIFASEVLRRDVFYFDFCTAFVLTLCNRLPLRNRLDPLVRAGIHCLSEKTTAPKN